jgi:Protein of unknown function (DUF2793)
MDATSNLSLPFIMAAQAQKHVTHNEALRVLDAVVQLMVLDKDLNSPPGSPAEGSRYIVAASPTGPWSGQASKIAAYQDGAWAFYVPREGWLAWAADEDALYVWTGSAWTAFAGGGGGGSLDNVVEDTTPQLGGDLDGNGHNIGLDDGTGITDDAGNEQVTFHKTASAVNQVGITNAATGSAPQIAAEGADTNIDLTLAGKGSGHPKATLFGVNATADATTKFVVAAAASLFDHAGNGHQHKINKNAAGDTASLLFQTANSGRAEMGTTGDDNFRFKVSADGSTWKEAIVIDRSTGAASFPLTPKREILTANRTYYVRTDGSDSNTGLVDSSGGAFLTRQKAYDVVAGTLDLAGFTVTVQIKDGTYTGGLVIAQPWTGGGAVTFQGNNGTPANVLISTTSADCYRTTCPLPGTLTIKDQKLQTTTSGDGILLGAAGLINYQNINFGACARGHIEAQGQGKMVCTGNCSITGGAALHMIATLGGVIVESGFTITLTGTPAFSSAFAQASSASGIDASATTYSGSATGTRYLAVLSAWIYTNGGANFFPGSVAGSVSSGGQYL